MKILVIGGTGFIGPYVLRQLSQQGHHLAVFHRGSKTADLPLGIENFLGERSQLAQNDRLHRFAPEIVIDMILSSGPQARELMAVFRGMARRVVALSSMDVYRAIGLVHGTGARSAAAATLDRDFRPTQRPASLFARGAEDDEEDFRLD